MKEILPILYQDEFLVAIDKPNGLLVHRSKIDRHETRFAMQILRQQLGQHVYLVHRLDKPTSGILLFALSPEVATQLTKLFAEKQIQKTYVAIVRGYISEEGKIESSLKDKTDKMMNEGSSEKIQIAITNYQRIGTVELPYAIGRYPQSRYSLVQLTPETGRRHQLRKHLKSLFHPVIGDVNYGDGKHNRFFRDQFQCNQLLLVAIELQFLHPITNQEVKISAPLPEKFQELATMFE
jgi:tRNA pseudouridine65 synthase